MTLFLKLTVLLFITSAERCHEICYLDIHYMVKTSSPYQCHFTKITKSWKKGKPPPYLGLQEYPLNRTLYLVMY